ncbi:MAG: alpha/beta hydrolase [Rhizobiaceae bacterium]|nr:MAG: alpha/beta hydrolase [Rhizobiaceae bacterium]CAG1004571.1 hypothetical protein RHIZO_03100 [Rhizobiaceae bacterium]
MPPFPVKVIRGAFGVAEHFVPRLSGRIAFELFCRTANPNAPSAGEQRALDQAVRFMAGARRHRLTARSGTVMAFEFRPQPGTLRMGTVLVIHGWRSRTEHMKTLIEAYCAAGYRVVAVDLPGHGLSAGRRLNMALAVDAVRSAGEWFGPFSAVLGHSFGGAVAVNAAVGSVKGIRPLATDRLVLIAAPSSMPAIFEDFGRFLNLGPRSQTAIAAQVERVAGFPLETFVGAEQLARLPIPTLVIHAPDDREVSPDNARAFAAAGDHVRLSWARALGHRRILADPVVADEAVRFVAEVAEPALVH